MKSDFKIRLYCCGGAGTNIGLALGQRDDVKICYIDTSLSNTVEGMPKEQCFFIPEKDGAGQDRKRIAADVLPFIPSIIEQFPPADFNIVMFSAAGGSGSVLGPLITSNLLHNKNTVVALTIGVDDSGKKLENTINTLKTLETMSLQTRSSLVMAYYSNVNGVPQKQTDNEILFGLEALFELASQNNHGLDTADLDSWTQFQRVSPIPPQLAALQIFDNRQEASGVLEPISIASLYNNPDKVTAFGNPYYNTVGHPRNPNPNMPEQLHFVINVATVDDITKALAERQTALARQFSGYRQRRAIVDVDDNMTQDGLIL